VASFNLVQAVFDRELLSADEDVAVCTMHIREAVSSAPDVLPITDQGRQAFANKWFNFWDAINEYVTDKVECRELRFYDVPDTPGIDMGDPVKISSIATKGTATSQPMPPQCAVSVTWRTSARLRWGRFYLPGVVSAHLDTSGRLDVATCDAIANAAHLLTDRSGTGGVLTVFSRKHWNHSDPELIQVDDIVDIIRRRRFSQPHYRATLPAG
jgi:hypothetical protein